MCGSHQQNDVRKFKYYPEDFGDLTVKVKHMDLVFDVFDDHTIVESVLHVEALEEIESLDLNAKELEVLEVKLHSEGVEYKHYKDEDILEVRFSKTFSKGESIEIYTKTICRPTANILEGLYYDVTPSGCPRQQITQCQQWGFQRIVPCIDDMTAKCTYKTVIIADTRYTNMITNGDVVEEVIALGDGERSKIVYDNSVTPMATYLFFLGVGTYATFKKEFEYPDGGSFGLELLVPPGSDEDRAEIALKVLADAVMWVYLFTGKDKYKNWDRSMQLWDLYEQRESLKFSGKNADDIGSKMKELAKDMHFGYRYTGSVYREIGMQNSDFGGMENVGNTTIVTNRIMPFEDMTDGSFEYMVRVKVHEYYHNLNGSEVTGRSPFEIWLNEAVTVFIERDYYSFLWGKDYTRLEDASYILMPGSGIMAKDSSAIAMPIEPDGFNDTNELITGVTYVKAPEFVRMIETLMGKEKFVEGLELYHSRFKHGNATRADWVQAMEDVSGMDFKSMAHGWLKKLRFPRLGVARKFVGENLVLSIRQVNCDGEPWEFPLSVAIFDKKGQVLEEVTVWVRDENLEMEFPDVAREYGFISFNRGLDAFASFVMTDVTDEELYRQLFLDNDVVGRFLAWMQIQEDVKVGLLSGNIEDVSERFVEAYMDMIKYSCSDWSNGSVPWILFEGVHSKEFADKYRELYLTKKRVKRAVADAYFEDLWEMWNDLSVAAFVDFESEVEMIKKRSVRNGILSIMCEVSDKDMAEKVWSEVKDQFDHASGATDRIAALSLYANSGRSDVVEYLMSKLEWASENLVRWETYLGVVSRIPDAENLIGAVKEIMKSEAFDMNQSSHQRSLLVGFAMNKKVSLETVEGRTFLSEVILKLAQVNEFTTLHILNMLGQAKDMSLEIKSEVMVLVDNLLEEFEDRELKLPSVMNNLKNIKSSLS